MNGKPSYGFKKMAVPKNQSMSDDLAFIGQWQHLLASSDTTSRHQAAVALKIERHLKA